VQVDGVLASDNIGDGGTASLGLLGLLGGGHFTSSLGERAVACRDALQVVTEDGVSQTFPTKLAKSQASLGVGVDHVRFPDVA